VSQESNEEPAMRIPIAIILAAGLAGPLLPVAVQAGEEAPPPVVPKQQAQTQRFATDATLRLEMQGIRAAVEALGHYEMGHMASPQAADFATEIEGHVRTIVATCKLPPDADAALHAIIFPLLQNATALKKKPQDLSSIPPMRDALERYDRQFYDP
jgi:hypothetical protein